MAGYACEMCSGEEQATLLITPLTGGDTMAVGGNCMGIALVGMTAGHFEVDAEKLISAIDRLVKARDKAAAKDDAEDQAAELPGAPEFPEGPTGSAHDDLAAIEAATKGPKGAAQAASWPPTADQVTAGIEAAEGRRSSPRHAERGAG